MVSEAVKTAFVRGEPDAVRDVYDDCGGLVFGVAYKVLGDHSLAEEAKQETFERAWKAAQSFDASRELEPWLTVIASRVARDIARREEHRRHETLGDRESASARLDEPLEFETLMEVRRALKALQPIERAVVYLQFYEGLTHVQIANRLRIPLGTVKSRSDRARRHLSDSLLVKDDPFEAVKIEANQGLDSPTAQGAIERAFAEIAMPPAPEPALLTAVLLAELDCWLSTPNDAFEWSDPPLARNDRDESEVPDAATTVP